MADINTLHGIAEARNELYNQVKSGEVPEARATVLERLLRGQTYVCGDLPMKYLNMTAKLKPGAILKGTVGVIDSLDRFLTPKALEGRSSE